MTMVLELQMAMVLELQMTIVLELQWQMTLVSTVMLLHCYPIVNSLYQ